MVLLVGFLVSGLSVLPFLGVLMFVLSKFYFFCMFLRNNIYELAIFHANRTTKCLMSQQWRSVVTLTLTLQGSQDRHPASPDET